MAILTTTQSGLDFVGGTTFIQTGGTSLMSIKTDGNVGIGTTAPGNLLHIHASGTNASALIIEDDLRRLQLGRDMIEARTADGSSVSNLYIQPNGNTGIAITSGKVGIGTSTPNATLEVNSTVGNQAKIRIGRQTTATNALELGTIGGSSVINAIGIASTNADLIFNRSTTTTTSESMRINGAGNLGIGATAPNAPLHIQKDSNASDVMVNLKNTKYGSTDTSGETKILFGWLNHEAANIAAYKDGTVNRTGFKFVGEVGYNTPVELMRITSAGNVGIGSDNPVTTYGGKGLVIENNDVAGIMLNDTTGAKFNISARSGDVLLYANTNTPIRIATNNIERARFTSGGNFLVGKTTDDDNTNGLRLSQAGIISASRNNNLALLLNRTGSDGGIVLFRNDGSTAGDISVSGTSTSYNTSSDYRLKENVVEMTGALDRVAQLKPSRFNFIADSDKVVDGFLAHEVQEVVPEAITGTKDAMKDEEYEVTPAVYEDKVHPAIEEVTDEEGNVITEAKESWTENVLVTEAVMGTRSVEDYQGIDQSKLVPLLVGAIQELRAEIELLKAK